MKDLGIVIPAYNEETGIADIIERIKISCPDARLLVVDDCSKDNTAQIARSFGAEVITNPVNYNYGKALKIGFDYQIKNNNAQYLAFLDADGTYPPEKIPELYSLCKKEDLDIAAGSRLLGSNKGMPKMRKIGNSIFAWLISKYTGKTISDSGTGLRVFKASLVDRFRDLPDGLNLTPAMTVNSLFEGLLYKEIPIEYDERRGKSKLSNIKDGFNFLSVIMIATRKHRPVRFYCTLGIPFIVLNMFVKLASSNKTAVI
jgi:glycosyltransferase involved in cell wall biosynthesis